MRRNIPIAATILVALLTVLPANAQQGGQALQPRLTYAQLVSCLGLHGMQIDRDFVATTPDGPPLEGTTDEKHAKLRRLVLQCYAENAELAARQAREYEATRSTAGLAAIAVPAGIATSDAVACLARNDLKEGINFKSTAGGVLQPVSAGDAKALAEAMRVCAERSLQPAATDRVALPSVLARAQPAMITVRVTFKGPEPKPVTEEETKPNAKAKSEFEQMFDKFFSQVRAVESAVGAGAIVSSNGHVLTTSALRESKLATVAETIYEVELSNERRVPADLVATDPELGLMMLKLRPGDTWPSLAFAARNPSLNESLFVSGAPYGLMASVRTSAVVSWSTTATGEMIEFSGPLHEAEMGAPAIDADGRVVAVVTRASVRQGDAMFTIHALPGTVASAWASQIMAAGRIVDPAKLETAKRDARKLSAPPANAWSNVMPPAVYEQVRKSLVKLDLAGQSVQGVVFRRGAYIAALARSTPEATTADVHLADGRTLKAKLIGHDPVTSLAVWKVDDKGEPPALAEFQTGVLPVGDGLFALDAERKRAAPYSGIVSGYHSFEKASIYAHLQSDMALPDNALPQVLFTADGKIAGFTDLPGRAQPTWQRVVQAVPPDIAARAASHLVREGRVAYAYAGVTMTTEVADSDTSDWRSLGVRITEVKPQSPAAAGGLQIGDIIVAVAGTPVGSPTAVRRLVMLGEPGSGMEFQIRRNDETKSLKLVLAPAK